MVTNVTSLTGNGLKDWLIQRVTAVFFAAYALYLLGFMLWYSDLTYVEWHGLFSAMWFQIVSSIALFMLVLHAWIGIWTVTTDYIKSTALRLSIQMLVVVWLLAQLIWGFLIIWGQ
ncbi:MAG: succinate dehydrogenase, hydrophobic membrane anchor protein [Legionellales bacterium]|nr:succinate dehydrogenase, hydrophobic membrane anchor protein [Legionellales bacterium]